jgi:hypothetical protein
MHQELEEGLLEPISSDLSKLACGSPIEVII